MNLQQRAFGALKNADNRPRILGRLFRKYVMLFLAVVCVALVSHGVFEFYFLLRDYKTLLAVIQRSVAETAAGKIKQFVHEIESQVGWTTQLPWAVSSLDEWRFDAARLFRQVPAITEFIKLDMSGREQLRVSRIAPDVIGSQIDFSKDPKFVEALANKVHYGRVHFRRDSEPHMTVAMAGSGRDAGVSIAEINLKFIWDVVSDIKARDHRTAYVVDSLGRLIAHPDLSLVLRKLDLSRLAHVREALASGGAAAQEPWQVAKDIQGQEVLTARAPVAPLGWQVFVELPVAEAYAPFYAVMVRSGGLLLAALALATLAGLLLTRKMMAPIQALSTGVARIGSGDLSQRISIKTGDELEALGEQFNNMAARLEESYSTLERRVEERTHQLEFANLAKSRFLAAASHDLRQPLHALGLFNAELRAHVGSAEGRRIVGRIDAAVAAMNELFNALLDTSKLDAGVLTPDLTEFPIEHLLQRIESTFAAAAREKRLSLRVAASKAWVCSDVVLLERILLNLVSNAVRYTTRGGVVVGCRRRGEQLRIEIWDSGPGIAEDQRKNIFGEFYQLAGPEQDRHSGLGLGLSIVERLCGILGHRIELTSTVGKGSRFAVVVPRVAAQALPVDPPSASPALDIVTGQLVVIVEDEALGLEGMGGLLKSWGFRVVAARDESEALAGIRARISKHNQRPDLIISDYQLLNGKTGIDVIAALRRNLASRVPAFLISGDTTPEKLRYARESGLDLLHKPVPPMRLRAMVNQRLKDVDAPEPEPAMPSAL